MQVFTGDLGDFDNLRDLLPPDEFGTARKHIRDFFEQFEDAPNVDRWLRLPTRGEMEIVRDHCWEMLDCALVAHPGPGARLYVLSFQGFFPYVKIGLTDREDPLERIREHEGVAKIHYYLLFDVWLSPPCPLPSDKQKKAVKTWEDAVLKAVEEECDPFRMRREYFPGLDFRDAVRIAKAHAHLAGLPEF